MSRKKLTRDGRHAAALLMIKRGDGTPIVTREEAAHLTALEIIETFAERTHLEHIVPHALTGNDHPSNIQYLTPDEHKPKTKRDVSEIAKTRRIEKKQAEFRSRLLAKTNHESDVEKSATKPKATLRSRGFQKPPAGTRHNWKTGKRERIA